MASGSSIDWVYGTQNVNITFTFEFRDKGMFQFSAYLKNKLFEKKTLHDDYLTGKHGFILPKEQIIPNSLEVLDGLIALVSEAKSLKYL